MVDATAELGELFERAGHTLYLVGGPIRDALIERPLDEGVEQDLDLTTDARPEAIKAIVAPWADSLWSIGEKFGTIGAMHGGRTFEITTHRAEVYDPDSRKPTVSFGTDILEDLSRRDFTI